MKSLCIYIFGIIKLWAGNEGWWERMKSVIKILIIDTL